MIEAIRNKYPPKFLFLLFLYISFPINLWALYHVADIFPHAFTRTLDLWYAFGVSAVILTFALFESAVVFGFYLLVGLIAPRRWNGRKLLMVLTSISLITTLWGALAQFKSLQRFLTNTIHWITKFYFHPVQVFYLVIGLLLLFAVALPAGVMIFFLTKNQNFTNKLSAIFQKLEILSILYLFLNLLGIIILAWRNLSP
ncbi:hypothetical protein ACFLYP_01660 [Chloroflexota bacterium]